MARSRFRMRPFGVCLVALLIGGRNCRADDAGDLRSRVEQQDQQITLQSQQIDALRQRLDSLVVPSGPLSSTATPGGMSASFLAPPGNSVPPQPAGTGTSPPISAPSEYEAMPAGGESTSDLLRMSTRWDPSNGLRFETADKNFSAHLGFRFQEDTVFFTQTAGLKAAAPVGIGDLEDGTFFRRIRPSWDGTAYGIIEWNCELALEQVREGIPQLDEVWVGVKDIPWVGSVRVGHMKVPQGFEGDMTSSSKAMTFLERSAYTDAFYQNFAPGVWVGNSVFDQRVTYAGMWYWQELALHDPNGAQFGDGSTAFTGRLTALPIYDCEGRCLLHLGFSGTWRKAVQNDPGDVGADFVRFRARPQLRDASGDFGSTTLPGDANRIVDTGLINADSATVFGLELFSVMGPFSIQSEYAFAYANDAIVNSQQYNHLGFSGGYVELSYFLTGENRSYDRRLGREGSTYIEKPNAVIGKGFGAVELACRYNHLDLNSANSVVMGGETDAIEVAVNWYLATNLKVQFEYLHQNRYNVKTGQDEGALDGFATRTQFFF